MSADDVHSNNHDELLDPIIFIQYLFDESFYDIEESTNFIENTLTERGDSLQPFYNENSLQYSNIIWLPSVKTNVKIDNQRLLDIAFGNIITSGKWFEKNTHKTLYDNNNKNNNDSPCAPDLTNVVKYGKTAESVWFGVADK